jgi:hypothetical protein
VPTGVLLGMVTLVLALLLAPAAKLETLLVVNKMSLVVMLLSVVALGLGVGAVGDQPKSRLRISKSSSPLRCSEAISLSNSNM